MRSCFRSLGVYIPLFEECQKPRASGHGRLGGLDEALPRFRAQCLCRSPRGLSACVEGMMDECMWICFGNAKALCTCDAFLVVSVLNASPSLPRIIITIVIILFSLHTFRGRSPGRPGSWVRESHSRPVGCEACRAGPSPGCWRPVCEAGQQVRSL